LQNMAAQKNTTACGYFDYDNHLVPVYGLNKMMQLQTDIKQTQTTLLVLKQEERFFALCCLGIQKMVADNLAFFKVPISMSSAKQPFTQLALVENTLAGLTSSAELWRVLAKRGACLSSQKNSRQQQGAKV
jgi:hypothetical protein